MLCMPVRVLYTVFMGLPLLFGVDLQISSLMAPKTWPQPDEEPPHQGNKPRGYAFAVLYCLGATLLGRLLHGTLEDANLILIYLLAVVLTTVQFGRGPGVAASILAVLAFDVFMVLPYHSLQVADPQYLLTFAMMLAVSLIVSHLMANQQYQAMIASNRERRAIVLFQLAQDLSGALTREQVSEVAVRHLDMAFQSQVVLLAADPAGSLDLSPIAALAGNTNIAAGITARAVYERARSGDGAHQMTVVGRLHMLPLRAPLCTRGVLVVQAPQDARHATPEQTRLLQTFAAQIALALERVHYVEVAHGAGMAMESERLRNSLLSAVSHDIRTPLTAIVGLSSTMASSPGPGAPQQRELALAIEAAALKMNSLVTNLLDMARLHDGAVRLNCQWQMIEEVIGGALASVGPALDAVALDIVVAPDLPLVSFDAVLIERVLCNLLDNALKYGASGGLVRIVATQTGQDIEVSVEDRGPGVAAGMESTIFSKFVRGEKESNKAGVGLGLAICSAIVEAHGGRIGVAPGATGGARFAFTLPLGHPPLQEPLEASLDPVRGAA